MIVASSQSHFPTVKKSLRMSVWSLVACFDSFSASNGKSWVESANFGLYSQDSLGLVPHLADKLGFATGTEEEADPQEAVWEAAAQVAEGGAAAARVAVETAGAHL